MKRINKIIAGIALVFISFGTQAQYAYFPYEGSITYEKTVHVKNLLRRHMNSLEGDAATFQRRYYEDLYSKIQETAVLKKTLSFNGNEVRYEPVKETFPPMISNLLMAGLLDYQSTSYQHLGQKVSKMSFEMGGTGFLIEDSLLNIKWKLTNEYRNIAGFECRRANGLTLDSVYVVAFYTDQIPVSAGPSNMHGLPGMILGLAVPEQHYNIYATKVEYNRPAIKSDLGGRRDKPMTRAELIAALNASLGQYMSQHQRNLLFAGMLL